MRSFLLVGKCFREDNSGPTSVIRELDSRLIKAIPQYTALLYTNSSSTIKYVGKLINECLMRREIVVNVHTNGFIIPFIVYTCSILNKHNYYYLTIHGLYRIDTKLSKKKTQAIYIHLENKLIKSFPNIICVSSMLKKDIETIYGREDRITVISNGTDAVSSITPRTDNDVVNILFLGGLKFNKGIASFIELCQELHVRNIPFLANIYGNAMGNDEWFKHQIDECNMERFVLFHGETGDKQKIYDAISSADIQICFSEYDTYNVAVAESIALGCPVVVSDRCGASEIVESKFEGIVVNMKEEIETHYHKTCAYIQEIYQHPELRQVAYKERENGRRKVEWNQVVEKYMALCE